MTETKTRNPSEIRDRIIEVVAGFVDNPDEVTVESNLIMIDLDSLDMVELEQIVDEEFGIKPQYAEVMDLDTVGDVIDMIVSRVT